MAAIRDAERIRLLQAALDRASLPALLAWRPAEIVMLTGSYPHFGQTLCLYPRRGRAVAYVPEAEPPESRPAGAHIVPYGQGGTSGLAAWTALRGLLAADLAPLGGAAALVGVAWRSARHTLPGYGAETPALDEEVVNYVLGDHAIDATAVFAALAQHKTRQDVAAIRRANVVAGYGLAGFYQMLEPGRSEAEIAGQVEATIQARTGYDGCAYARAWAFVQSGPNAALAGRYSRSSGRKLADGDMVVLELATCVDGYWSDLTRTGVVGTPSMSQGTLLAAVREAQHAAIGTIRPGVTHEAVDKAAREVLAGRGLAAGFTHATGHHVGFRYHDDGPMLAPGSSEPLQAGMVITVEPGAYGAQFGGGARFEDNVLVTENGGEILSPYHIA